MRPTSESPEAPPAADAGSGSLLDEMKSFVSSAQTRRQQRENFNSLLPSMVGAVPAASPSRSPKADSLASTPPEFREAQQAQAQHPAPQQLTGAEAWSEREVCSWVLQSGLGQWLKAFREHQIDGYELLRLTPGDLRVELGIRSLAVRKKILDGVAKLQGFEGYTQMTLASADTDEQMMELCEAERLALAELQRFEELLCQCREAADEEAAPAQSPSSSEVL